MRSAGRAQRWRCGRHLRVQRSGLPPVRVLRRVLYAQGAAQGAGHLAAAAAAARGHGNARPCAAARALLRAAAGTEPRSHVCAANATADAAPNAAPNAAPGAVCGNAAALPRTLSVRPRLRSPRARLPAPRLPDGFGRVCTGALLAANGDLPTIAASCATERRRRHWPRGSVWPMNVLHCARGAARAHGTCSMLTLGRSAGSLVVRYLGRCPALCCRAAGAWRCAAAGGAPPRHSAGTTIVTTRYKRMAHPHASRVARPYRARSTSTQNTAGMSAHSKSHSATICGSRCHWNRRCRRSPSC